jgi:hypothetical protein
MEATQIEGECRWGAERETSSFWEGHVGAENGEWGMCVAKAMEEDEDVGRGARGWRRRDGEGEGS